MFGTGLREVPASSMKPQPQIIFQKARFPVANVCANTIKLPISHTYEAFQEAMDFGLQNAPGFGLY